MIFIFLILISIFLICWAYWPSKKKPLSKDEHRGLGGAQDDLESLEKTRNMLIEISNFEKETSSLEPAKLTYQQKNWLLAFKESEKNMARHGFNDSTIKDIFTLFNLVQLIRSQNK